MVVDLRVAIVNISLFSLELNSFYTTTGRNQLTGTIPAEFRNLPNAAIDFCKFFKPWIVPPSRADLSSQIFSFLGIHAVENNIDEG
jgi:hypothetical protein